MSYLLQLKQIPQPGQETVDTVLPALLTGQEQFSSRILPTLRRQQLLDLARAYGLNVPRDGTQFVLVRMMQAYEDQGVFLRPPKNPYYFMKAKYTSDEMKEAKDRGGFFGKGNGMRICEVLQPWNGLDAEFDTSDLRKAQAKVEPKQSKKNPRVGKGEIFVLRQQCKARGLNSFGKGVETLREMIAEHDKKALPVDIAS